MANKENQPPALAAPLLSSVSPSNKPALNRQRDHSACRRPETPLKVRKTRENLKQCSLYADIPPPCVHAISPLEQADCNGNTSASSGLGQLGVPTYVKDAAPMSRQSRFEEDTGINESISDISLPVAPRVQRQKSVSRRMLSRMKQGISNRTKISQAVRPMESENSLVRKLSGRRRQEVELDRRSQSFEVARPSIESGIDEMPDSISFASASVQRSFTSSTVSTAEVLGESLDPATPKDEMQTLGRSTLPGVPPPSSPVSQPPTSPSPQPTPRPPPRKEPPPLLATRENELCLAVPCVDLYVAMDAISVDVHSKRDIWVAVEATVRSMNSKIHRSNALSSSSRPADYFMQSDSIEDTPEIDEALSSTCTTPNVSCGAITTMRLCFKPVQGCQLREVIGQKSIKDLVIGQQCSLFIKLRVPKIRVRDSTVNPDQESLFTELESIVGTLKVEILHVEARYRHSMLPMDNVVTVRHICKIKRPKTESRWSIAGPSEEIEAPAEVHTLLARYVATHYSSDKALELLEQYLGQATLAQPGIREIYESLTKDKQTNSLNDSKPSVIITDIDLDAADSGRAGSEDFSTAPNTPTTMDGTHSQPANSTSGLDDKMTLQPTSLNLAPPLLTLPKTTTALSTEIPSANNEITETRELPESQDSARQLWRHIRRTSLSTRQLQEMNSSRLSQLEASDEHLKELRRKALANKRSIGAETLRAWKWDENMRRREEHGEAPWM